MAHSARTSECIEALCQEGCRAVREHIAALEAGEVIAGTEALSEAERCAVLAELKAIMAVYDRPCPC